MSVRDVISDIRNVSLFILSLSSTASCIYYQYALTVYGPNNWGQVPLEKLCYFLFSYAIVDGYLCSTYELKIHHLIIIGILYCDYFHNNPPDRLLILYPLVKTEVSSIFYVLKNWLPENTKVYNLNLLLFYFSFMKFRIYDMYVELIHRNTTFDILVKNVPTSYLYGTYATVYGLYLLNLYWGMILNKMLFKTLSSFLLINNYTVCYSMTSLMYLFHIPLSFSLYPHIYDCVGTSIMSICSYVYHRDVYQRLKHKSIETYNSPTSDNAFYFIFYTVSIQTRWFFAVVSYVDTSLFLVSVMSHVFTLYRCIHHFSKNVHDIHFLRYKRRILALPFFVDGILIGTASPKKIIPLFVLYSTMVLLHMLTPFYKLTPFSMSLGMLAQTYIFQSE